jgi:hypothetical protein
MKGVSQNTKPKQRKFFYFLSSSICAIDIPASCKKCTAIAKKLHSITRGGNTSTEEAASAFGVAQAAWPRSTYLSLTSSEEPEALSSLEMRASTRVTRARDARVTRLLAAELYRAHQGVASRISLLLVSVK